MLCARVCARICAPQHVLRARVRACICAPRHVLSAYVFARAVVRHGTRCELMYVRVLMRHSKCACALRAHKHRASFAFMGYSDAHHAAVRTHRALSHTSRHTRVTHIAPSLAVPMRHTAAPASLPPLYAGAAHAGAARFLFSPPNGCHPAVTELCPPVPVLCQAPCGRRLSGGVARVRLAPRGGWRAAP